MFQGQTKVTGAALFGDDGSYGLDNFQIVAKQARLDANGRLGADQTIEGHVTLRAMGEEGQGARAGDVEIGALDFQLDAAGPMLAPALDLKLHVADAKAPPGRIGKLDALVTARPDGPATDPKSRVDVAADASGEGLDFSDSQLEGRHWRGFRAHPAREGRPQRRRGCVSRPDQGGRRRGRGYWPVRPQPAQGAGHFQSRRTCAVWPLFAQTALAGSARGTLDLSGDPAEGRIDANVAISTDRLATGIEAADGLIGGNGQDRGRRGQNQGRLPLRRPEPCHDQSHRAGKRPRLA